MFLQNVKCLRYGMLREGGKQALECVKFKVVCLVRQSLSWQVPLCLADNCCFVSNSTRRALRSSDTPLHGAMNTQQLRRQNFCSRWTLLVELSSGPAAQSIHHLRTV